MTHCNIIGDILLLFINLVSYFHYLLIIVTFVSHYDIIFIEVIFMLKGNFAHAIKSIRKTHNITQEEMATKLGITRSGVAWWELGRSIPQISMINTICKLYNVDHNFLFGEGSNISDYQTMFGEINRIYQKLSIKGKALMLANAYELEKEESNE